MGRELKQYLTGDMELQPPRYTTVQDVMRTSGRVFGKLEIWSKYAGWLEITNLISDSALGYSVVYPDRSADNVPGNAALRVHE